MPLHVRGRSLDFGFHNFNIASGTQKPLKDFFDVTPEEEAALKEFEPQVQKLVSGDRDIGAQNRNDCLRFLRARLLNTKKALALLEESEHERSQYSPVSYEDVRVVFEKALAYVSGEDAKKRPIVYVDPDKFRKDEDNITTITKFIIFMMDDAVRRAQAEGQEQVVLTFDLTRFSLLSMDYQVIKQMLHVLMSVFPERVYQLVVYNPPYFFTAAWPIIKPWLDENSINKIHFLRRKEKLFETVFKEALPEALGGTYHFDPKEQEKAFIPK